MLLSPVNPIHILNPGLIIPVLPFCVFTAIPAHLFPIFGILFSFAMKKTILSILFGSIAAAAMPQQKNGSISGSINGTDNKSVESATVLLLKGKDSSVSKTAITDQQGQFHMEKILYGKYFIAITAQGHAPYKSSLLVLDSTNHILVLPVIVLAPAAKNLQAVTVTAQKPFIERKIDRLIVNVAASPMSAGQSAFDILERSPGISIDENDNISINGKQGVMIYIDNKISYLAGRDLTNYLRALPASQLDQLEIMTQPPARYDAAGNSGIINFKTKKNQNNGLTGSLSSSQVLAYYFKTRNSIVLNWKKNKLNLSANYSITDNKIFINQDLYRAFRKNAATPFNRYYDATFRTTREFFLQSSKLTIDYQASKNTTVGIMLNGNFNQTPSHASGRIDILDSLQQLASYTLYTTGTKIPVSNPGFNLNFSHKLPKGKEWTIDADYILYRNSSSQTAENYIYNANGSAATPQLLKNSSPLHVDIYSLKSDYSQPLPKNGKLEAGIKTSYVKTNINGEYSLFDTTQGKWVQDSGSTNHFIFEENINAAYVSFNSQLSKKFSLQAGLRAEQTHNDGHELIKDSHFSNTYIQLFPSIFGSYTPNDKNTFTFTYGRRIDRPGYQALNPFKTFVDQFLYREGNPYLKPIFTNNFEFSWNYRSLLNLTLNFTRSVNVISAVLHVEKSGNDYITYQIPNSIASRRNMGIAIDFHKKLTKWWTTNSTVNIFNNRYNDYYNGVHITPQITICIVNVSNQFILKKGWTIDLSGFYRSKRLEGFPIYAIPSGSFSTGVSKKIKSRITLTANLNDPFWLLRGGISSNTETFFYKGRNRNENRYLTLTFSYRFGKSLQLPNRRNVSSPDELNRL